MIESVVGYLYVASAILFVLALKWMSEVKTAWGNWAGSLGMLIAIAATMIAFKVQRTEPGNHRYCSWIINRCSACLKTAYDGRAAANCNVTCFRCVSRRAGGTAEYYQRIPQISNFAMIVLTAEMILGFLPSPALRLLF